MAAPAAVRPGSAARNASTYGILRLTLFDDAVEHIFSLANAGVHDVALFPCPELAVARAQLDDAIRLKAVLRWRGGRGPPAAWT